jgi:ABC-type nitrate/sulfonate/bicarbonate transport system substrate-binding protein
MKFKIGGVPEHFNYPWRLAIENGAFKDLNISLHWSDMTGGTGQMIKGLETGSLDIAVLLSEGISKAILQGAQAKIIDVYVNSPLQWGIHVPSKSPIQSPSEFNNPTFAISRYGSGSHLMAFVLAKKFGIPYSHLKFNVIGDVYGGIWALENQEADIFLWEKYTTSPFVQKGSCKNIGQVDTPWPCFVIACRAEVLAEHSDIIHALIDLVKSVAKHVKNDPQSPEKLAWRYHLNKNEIAQWLQETEWNLQEVSLENSLRSTVEFLTDSALILDHEQELWQNKLFL